MSDSVPDRPAPKVFLSYSWTSPEYELRVLAFAESLVRDGVDVVLDKWHLAPGQDAFAFMERSVVDASIGRVLILCDPRYAEKANAREGGVGTETLVITPAVYGEVAQTKFIPVIMERAADGSAPRPAYLGSRIYIDLSDPEREPAEYERLLRVIYGQPEFVPPPLGARPSFLDPAAASRTTTRPLAAFRDALLRGRPGARGFLDDYLTALGAALDAARPPKGLDRIDALVDATLAQIAEFLPYRNEFVEAMQALARAGDDLSLYDRLHRLFERATAAVYDPMRDAYADHMGAESVAFLARELLLCAVAVLLDAGRYDAVGRVTAPLYVARSTAANGGSLEPLAALDLDFRLLDRPTGPAGVRIDVASLLGQRATPPSPDLAALAEAECVVAVRARLDAPREPDLERAGFGPRLWWPRLYPTRGGGLAAVPLGARLRDPSARDSATPRRATEWRRRSGPQTWSRSRHGSTR